MKAQKPCADETIIAEFYSEVTKDWLNAPDQGKKFELRCLGEHRTPVTECFTRDEIDRAVELAFYGHITALQTPMISRDWMV
jgi:hypothetical protein